MTGDSTGSGAASKPSRASPFAPGWFHLLAGCMFVALVWLGARARVYIDQVWLTEWGRRLLEPATDHSMFMLVDGTTLPPPAWLGPLLAECLFRMSGDLIAFRSIAAAAAIAMAYGVLRLALRAGAPMSLAALAAAALLLDPTIVQSVVVGRADTLSIAVLVAGLLLASRGFDDASPGIRGPVLVAAGYSLAVLSPAIWSAALLLGPLALLHWVQAWGRARRAGWGQPARITVFALIPGLLLALTVGWPMWQAHAAAAPHAVDLTRSYGEGFADALFAGVQMLAVSLPLLILGVAGACMLPARRLGLWLLAGMLLVLCSGFYPFRIPYLQAWATAALILAAASVAAPRATVLSRLGALLAAIGVVLMLVRVLLAGGNQPPPGTQPWVTTLPPGTRVADFGWDFYVAARNRGLPIMRAFPGIPDASVAAWLRTAQPDIVLRPALPQNAWIMVDDADSAFSMGNYCQMGYLDWTGQPVSPDARVRQPPTPLGWRLGMTRDHGPYVWWVPCDRVPASVP